MARGWVQSSRLRGQRGHCESGSGLCHSTRVPASSCCRAFAKEVDDLVAQRKQDTIPALTAAPLLIADNVETADLVTSGGMEFLDQWQAAADAGVRVRPVDAAIPP